MNRRCAYEKGRAARAGDKPKSSRPSYHNIHCGPHPNVVTSSRTPRRR